MKAVTISEAKNNLSELLVAVRAGEDLTILDRKLPIARVEVIREVAGNPHVSPPRSDWNPEKVLALPLAKMSAETSSLTAVVAEERGSSW